MMMQAAMCRNLTFVAPLGRHEAHEGKTGRGKRGKTGETGQASYWQDGKRLVIS